MRLDKPRSSLEEGSLRLQHGNQASLTGSVGRRGELEALFSLGQQLALIENEDRRRRIGAIDSTADVLCDAELNRFERLDGLRIQILCPGHLSLVLDVGLPLTKSDSL